MMLNASQTIQDISRRELLQRVGTGVGSIALASLLADDLPAGESRQQPHFPARVKNVIFLHMVGAPSQLDLFENKPALMKNDGKECPKHLLEGAKFAFIRGTPKLLGSRMGFRRCGESGLELSNLLPHLGGVADEMAIIKTLHTEQFNHGPAQLLLHTGFERFGRPTMGSWINYGLGSDNANLPGFVVLITGSVGGAGNSMWGSGFLPTQNQGVEFRSQGDPVLFLSNPKGVSRDDRRRTLNSINTLNRAQLADVGDPEIATRIRQYELAFRMQVTAPEAMDIAGETKQTLESYGAQPGMASFANNCLLARRLAEAGVRFIEVTTPVGWDHHFMLKDELTRSCAATDRPVAALLADLKQRGLLEDTLVIWAGEFGRTPYAQSGTGRDHNNRGFTVWMAGGGVQGGMRYGATDDYGHKAVENPVHIHDWHATILHLLGLDHQALTYRYAGRDVRLTDVHGDIMTPILA